MKTKPDVVIEFTVIHGSRKLTDGTNVFWRERGSRRIRWAMISKPDDGLGYRTHGAAENFGLAIEDAEQARRDIEDVKRG